MNESTLTTARIYNSLQSLNLAVSLVQELTQCCSFKCQFSLVIPAKAGIQCLLLGNAELDSGFRRNDDLNEQHWELTGGVGVSARRTCAIGATALAKLRAPLVA